MMHEHGVRAARVNFLTKAVCEALHHFDEGHMIVAEDDEIDEKVDAKHNDESFEDADGVSEDAAKERQQQRVAAMCRHMREADDHLPAGEDHEHGERKIRQMLQQMGVEDEDENDACCEEIRHLRDGTGEGVRSAFCKAVEVRHAAKEAAADVCHPDGKQAVVRIRRTAERVQLFDRSVAHHLLNHVDQRQHECVADDLGNHLRRDDIKVRKRPRQLDRRVLDVEHRDVHVHAGDHTDEHHGHIGHRRVFGLVFSKEVKKQPQRTDGEHNHLDSLHAEPLVTVADDAVSVRQEFESDLEPDACQQSLDKIARDRFENETLEIELPGDGLHHGGAEDEKGHVLHAKFMHAHRKHWRESSRHTWHADVVARTE